MDHGLVEYYKKKNGVMYGYTACCTCKAGNQYSYDGQGCEKKSNYYMASVDMVFDQERKEEIAKKHFEVYMKSGKEKALQEGENWLVTEGGPKGKKVFLRKI